MRWIVLAFALLFSTAASAQCSGVFPNQYFCGNQSGAPNVPTAIPIPAFPSASLDTLCASNSNSLVRLAGTWQCLAYSAQFSVGATLNITSLAYSLLTGVPSVRIQVLGQGFFANSSNTNTANCNGATCSIGNNANDCKTILTACRSLQRVNDLINSTYDAANTSFSVTLADTAGITGSDPTQYVINCSRGPWIGTSVLQIQGSSATPSNVQMQPVNGGVIGIVANGCTLAFNAVHFIDSPGSTAAQFINAGGGHGFAHVDIGNTVIDACAICSAFDAESGSSIAIVAGNSIVGNVFNPFLARGGGIFDFNSNTVAVSNNLTFNSFANTNTGGQINGISASTFGSPTGITGNRCNIQGPWSLLNLNPNAVFPGSVDCAIQETIGAIGLQKGVGAASTVDYGTQYAPLQSGGGLNSKDTWGGPVIYLSPVLFANLPSPTFGMIAAIQDALAGNCGDSACAAWATTVTGGGGALKRTIQYNGTNWTIYGK